MAGYSDSEIEASVSNFVKSDVTVQKDPLGPIDLSSKFNEVIQLASSTLIFDPNAVFYLIYLATNRLNTRVLTAIGYVEDVQQAIQEMGKRTKDVTKTTLLGDAAAALLTVDSILSQSDTLSSSAFNRYKDAVDRFTEASLSPNIRDSGEIVRAPQLARKEVITTLSSLSALWPLLLETLTQIEGELSEFLELNLPVKFIQSSVRRVRTDLDSWQTTFEDTATTRDDKIADCRDAYLSLTSGRSVLDNYTTVTDPTDPRLEGSSTIVGRAALPAGDGELSVPEDTNTRSGPWAIVAGSNEFKVAADGGSEVTYTITPPDQPSVTGYVAHQDETEFFEIVTGENDRLEIDGLAPLISLTVGVGRTATQIVADIDAWITANYAGLYSAAVVSSGGRDFVKVTKTQTGIQRLRVTADDPTDTARITKGWQTLGFWIGQEDSNVGISAAEFVELLNDAGDFEAEVETTLFEDGVNGEVTSSTVFEVPENTIATTAHVDDMLLIRDTENAGYHRIVSIVRTAGVDRVTVDAGTPFLTVTTDQTWQVLRELVTIRSAATDLTARLVIGSGSANSTLGFTPATLVGTTTGFRVAVSGVDEDFTRRDVVEGDSVRISKGPGYAETEHTVLELSDDNRQLELSPPVDVDLNTTTYPDLDFEVLSASFIAYEAFVDDVADWRDLLAASDYTENILELERAMNPLITNKTPSAAQIGDANTAANNLYALLTNASPSGLTEVLSAFEVSAVPRIDAALNMLVERGLDRAYDQLMVAEIAAFFGMDKDDASSSSYMLKTMRTVVQSDLRTSKLEEDVDDVTHLDEVEDTDADFDFSDGDADENIEILGEVPDFDLTGDEDSTSRVRY